MIDVAARIVDVGFEMTIQAFFLAGSSGVDVFDPGKRPVYLTG